MKRTKRLTLGTCYLIHFDQKLAHAQHYIGFVSSSRSALKRLADHRASHGATILRVLNAQAIGYHVVRIWRRTTRTHERQLKNKKCAPTLCPICNPKAKRFLYPFYRR